MNPKDPFNSSPLTIEELIPNDELKRKIDDYKLQKINALKNQNRKEINKTVKENESKENIDNDKINMENKK